MDTLLNAIVKPFVNLYEAIDSPWNMILAIVLGLVVIFCVFMVRTVPHDKKAVRKRWGDVVFDHNGRARIVNPGFNVVVPWMWDYELVGTLDRTFDIDSITIEYSKYNVYRFEATVRFSVQCVYGVRYIVEDFVNTLTSASADVLRSCLRTFPPDEIDPNRTQIDALFAEKIHALAEELGTSFRALNLKSVEPNMEARKAEAQSEMAKSQGQIAQAIASLGPDTALLESFGVSLTPPNGNHSQ